MGIITSKEKWVRPTSKPPLLLDFTRKQSSLDSDVVRDSSMRDRLSSTSRDVPTVPAPSTTTVSASLTSGNARTPTPARTTSADGWLPQSYALPQQTDLRTLQNDYQWWLCGLRLARTWLVDETRR